MGARMALINRVTIDLFGVVDRHLRARQDQIPTTSTTIPQDPSPPLSTDPTSIPSQTTTMIGSQPSGGPTSSPLLFFVALGFGVVFTNLWIIVGVKYCFRYNARNRAMRSGNDADPITLDNMHPRQRRRREKKLMTMDEVNERFPLTKYKTWAASRAREGLPTTGGVSAPPSQEPSIRNQSISISTSPPMTPSSPRQPHVRLRSDTIVTTTPILETGHDPEMTQISEKNALSPTHGEESNRLEVITSAQTLVTPADKHTHTSSEDEDEDEDEDDQINTAVPLELLSSPGDSCAICIDTLEEEDEIRGLSCGHAFHAGCLDPWLTSRRACCPLCKADYYIPKARPDGENGEAERSGRSDRPIESQHSQSLWNGMWSATSRLFRARNNQNHRDHSDNHASNQNTNNLQQRPSPANAPTQSMSVSNPDPETSQSRRWHFPLLSNRFRSIQLPAIPFRRNHPTEIRSNNLPPASPSQLEAGVRS